MKTEDYDAVYGLWMSCKGMGLNDVDDSREDIERFWQREIPKHVLLQRKTAKL